MSVHISTSEKIFLIKRLSYLVNANIPLLESLVVISEQTTQKNVQKILKLVITDVMRGQSLGNSMGSLRKSFGDFLVNVISAGESTGMLGKNLSYLAIELKKQQALRSKIIGAFMYPIIVIFATFGITGFLMLYLFPKITPVFKSLHIVLPWSTRFLISSSDFLKLHGFVFIVTLTVSITALIIFIQKNKTLKIFITRAVLRLPIFGNIVTRYTLAQSSRTIGLLLQSGIPLSDAVPITAQTTSNMVYKKEFEDLSHTIARGGKMSEYFSEHNKLFPDMVCHITAIGERSGSLSSSLIYLSELYEGEVDEFTKNIGTTIEPLLMIVMGLIVGFIAVSIITPIYSITQNLHP
jgi:type IV pilus assembly protein PilC